ncbi:Rho-binding antiterminator [Vibrio sp. VPAP30]|uniref:Rho-binding antiterminator n=1 Tax=Vibrio sp. VPAP30 TaxID=1647102 RepID=UPI0006585767|nr:Rho-binding antiterminator [Vibrio sp. VPAP30]KLN65788.1 transcriptional regulator [Vibrio sp. VPAP30]
MISCNDYDYIEIVCMYRYPVRLHLKSGVYVEGEALDTARNEDKQECIKVSMSGIEHLVVLDDLAELEVLTNNPHFINKLFY